MTAGLTGLTETGHSTARPAFDEVFVSIAGYVTAENINFSEEAFHTAWLCLLDSLACAWMACGVPACMRLLGPLVPGTVVPNGVRVPGTAFKLDPVTAAFNIGTLVRWLDFNDTWLATEWGHPSDNLGAILAASDFVAQSGAKKIPVIQDILKNMIRAYEIQGVLALENSFNRVGLDHVILVKTASAAVAMQILGGSYEQTLAVLSQGFVDGQALRTYRHAPNTGSRKSWAAGDATARALWLAFMVMRGEAGYPHALTTKQWGFYDASFRSGSFQITRPFGSYVMENILFKVLYPAEFHAQTAIECAVLLHEKLKKEAEKEKFTNYPEKYIESHIEKIVLTTHESAMRIICKTGPLHNDADRDHCLQYMVAVALLYGPPTPESYSDHFAKTAPAIDALREKMEIVHNENFSRDYLDPGKRSIANAVEIFLKNGESKREEMHYPAGHKTRRKEAEPLLIKKFSTAAKNIFGKAKSEKIIDTLCDKKILCRMPVTAFMTLLENSDNVSG